MRGTWEELIRREEQYFANLKQEIKRLGQNAEKTKNQALEEIYKLLSDSYRQQTGELELFKQRLRQVDQATQTGQYADWQIQQLEHRQIPQARWPIGVHQIAAEMAIMRPSDIFRKRVQMIMANVLSRMGHLTQSDMPAERIVPDLQTIVNMFAQMDGVMFAQEAQQAQATGMGSKLLWGGGGAAAGFFAGWKASRAYYKAKDRKAAEKELEEAKKS